MRAAADFDATRAIQWEASDPAASAWVVANAGAGKTHVLTQRVIRLLLAGADPAAILCLTFTKVAAAEMTRRIFGTLGQWATLPEAELAAAVRDVQGRPASRAELRRARRLFARALETPGGLKVQTIHAFCERLLHQFPFEANVPGQFAILDDTAAAALIAAARAEIMEQAVREPHARLGRAIRYLAEHATDGQIGDALDAVVAKREAIYRWIVMSASEGGSGGLDDALGDLRTRLGLGPDDTEEALCREICAAAGWGRQDCGNLADALKDVLTSADNRNDRDAHASLCTLIGATEPGAEAAARLAFFLTEDEAGGLKCRSASQRFGAAFARSNPGLADRFGAESERLARVVAKFLAVQSFAATEALMVVGDAILQAYHATKRRAAMLDFGDLIVKARNLLSRADAAAWVLYKLDSRIEHILVDEAQDTSPDQWAVVRAIAADFFAGAGAVRAPRTIFAVGDDKQSIFGFQGAAPHMLADMARFFERAALDAGASFVRRPLALSFRSTVEVLKAVDHVFSDELADRVTASGYELHAARRLNDPGRVVLMPRVVRQRVEAPEDWTEPFDAPTAAEVDLADAVAGEIDRLIGTLLPSGKRIEPGGILVLARKRDAFFAAMNRALRARRITAAGADRLPVATHIAVLDLLALADVMLLPQDDLQLAACLKSPLFGLDEDELMRLAAFRGGASLWAALRARPEEPFGSVAERLRRWRSMADTVTPFRFFATVLGPDWGRRAFRARLGGEADDVLDALLSQALAYEAIEPPSLQGFLAFVRASQSDIKREAEEASAGVRVMTVHGAKGLEADVVFLVDTGGPVVVPAHRDLLVQVGGGADDPAFLWRRPAREAVELQRRADAAADEDIRKEYLRLLYVAMTRARDVLYVAGIRRERSEEDCWYKQVERALVPEDAPRDPESGELLQAYEWPQAPRPAGAAREVPPAAGEGTPAEPPDWLFRPAPSPIPAPQPLRPSQALAEPDPRVGGDDRRAGPAIGLAADLALRRGRAVHLLLQFLPGVPQAERGAKAARMLQREFPSDPALAESVWQETQAVLAEPALARLFGPESRAEIGIVGRVSTVRGDYAVSGRIDRVVRSEDGWHLLDFKTGVVPDAPAQVDPAYVLQLALYRRLVMEMEPGVEVRATLVYTAGPNILPIPAARMEEALAELGIGAIAFP